MVLITFALVLLFRYTEPYSILALVPFPGASHFKMFEVLFKGLVGRGHEVDVVSHFPTNNPTPRYNDLSLRGDMPMFMNNLSLDTIFRDIGDRWSTIDYMITKAGLENCKMAFDTSIIQNLKHSKKKYDLIVTQIFGCDCMLGFGHLFKAPVISITTNVNFAWGTDRVGNPDNPSYIPSYSVPYVSRMRFFQRLENLIVQMWMKFKYLLSANAANTIARNFFGEDLPDLRDLACNTSLLLANSHFSINFAVPNVPNVIEVAGLHIPPVKRLPKHFEELMNVSSNFNGVIYLSLGSMVLTETFPVHTLTAFVEAFRELPYKVLWKAARENMPAEIEIPSNVHFESWMPQLDILCHPNTKLFISHGGLMGTQEALHCGVPRLGVPLFGDQEFNLRTSEAMGVAIIIDLNNLTKHNILTSAKLLLEDASYSKNTKAIAERFKDRPLSPLDTAIYWVEYVIRHNGASHLRTVGADLPWYQYFLLDVGAILLGALVILLIIITYILSFMLRLLSFNIKRFKNTRLKKD